MNRKQSGWLKSFFIIGIVLLMMSMVACEEDPYENNLTETNEKAKIDQTNSTGTALFEDTESTSEVVTEAASSDEPSRFIHIGNDKAVFNGGTPAIFELTSDYHVTEFWSYHWNGGKGAPAGTLTIVSDVGTVYGPYQAERINDVYWAVKTPFDLPQGVYTVTDSDPTTWSQNKETSGMGMIWLVGLPQ